MDWLHKEVTNSNEEKLDNPKDQEREDLFFFFVQKDGKTEHMCKLRTTWKNWDVDNDSVTDETLCEEKTQAAGCDG